MSTPDYAAGAAGKATGMQQVSEHADREFANWTEEAAEALGWAASLLPPDQEFTIEQLRMKLDRLPEPPALRAWGPAALRATKLGYIERVGFGRSACARLAFVAMYRKGVWRR